MRLRMDLAYDGAGFHGWARQPGLRTVQGELEQALATVLRVDEVAVTCAGRTDTGVHARGQVAHVDVDARTGPGPAAPAARRSAARRRPRTPRGRGRGRLRRPLLGGVAPLRLPDRRPPGAADPLTRGHVLAWRRAARPRRHRHRVEGAARPPRLRVVLQAARGRDDDPHAPRPRRGSATRPACSSPPSAPTRSATTWCARSWAAWWPSARAGDHRVGRRGAGGASGATPSVTVAPAHGLTLEEVGYPPDDELAAQAEAARRLRTLEDVDAVSGR